MSPARNRPGALRRRLAGDRRGVTAVEFAMASPVLLVLLMGTWDIGHMTYLTAVVRGAAEQVARRSTLEDANVATMDKYVDSVVQGIAPDAEVKTTRSSYYDFNDIKRPEAWNDKNKNGICDNAEGYTDENRNGQWDADIGKTGNGGANDVVIYTVSVTYKPLFSVPYTTNPDATRTVKATAVRKNQPYALQASYGSAAGNCK